ncbi:hypothetical protein K3495_g2294 [Podosphaera aphanis]|nr:hypothetical protein K3495_g2294 [Podosphaera aphanis]
MEICRGDSPTLNLLSDRGKDKWQLDQNPTSTIESPIHKLTTESPGSTESYAETVKESHSKRSEKRLEKGKSRAYEIEQPDGTLDINTEPIMDVIQPAKDNKDLSFTQLISPNPRVDARRAIFQNRLQNSAKAKKTDLEGKEGDEAIFSNEYFIDACVYDAPTSARSFGTTKFGAGIWRDFAYQWPWPDPPKVSPLLSPQGFGKFFSRSQLENPEIQEVSQTAQTLVCSDSRETVLKTGELFGELKLGGEFYSDPRTANKVDEWLQCYSHPNKPFWKQFFGDKQRKSLIKQIFDDPEELGLLYDILALIDYQKLLRKNGYRHQSTKSFCKFYRKNGEIILTPLRGQVEYKIDKVPSLDLLNDPVRWREAGAAWNAPYTSLDIICLQPLQRDANSLARSYYNLRVRKDPELRFIHVYQAFFQLELYCEMFRLTTCFTPETSRETLERTKRIFFERYQPAQAELVLKISRWLVREWICIEKLGDCEIKAAVQESLKIDEVYNAHQRYFGVRFFAELLYSSLPIQIALILRNKWQLSMIKFTWRTNCWAAQDVDENGEVLFITDQGLIMEDSERRENERRLFGLFNWKGDYESK